MSKASRSVAVGTILRFGAAGLGFFQLLIVARLYGAAITGEFYLFVALSTVLSTTCRLGMDGVILRRSSLHSVGAHEDAILQIAAARLQQAFWPQYAAFIFLGIGLSVLKGNSSFTFLAAIMGMAAFYMAHLNFQSNWYISQNNQLAAITRLQVMPPLLTSAIALFLGLMKINQSDFAAETLALGYTAALALSSKWSNNFDMPIFRANISKITESLIKDCKKESDKLLVPSVLSLTQNFAPTIIVGLVCSTADVAAFSSASRLCSVIAMIGISATSVYSPNIARLHSAGAGSRNMTGIAFRTASLSMALALFPMVLFYSFPSEILRIFNDAFSGAGSIVRILLLGQVSFVALGWSAQFLIMIGEGITFRFVSVTTSFFFLLSTALGAFNWGLIGAAFGAALGAFLQNLIFFYSWTHRRAIEK